MICNFSGGLHPCEGYLLLPPIHNISDNSGVYHYNIKNHSLELLTTIPTSLWQQITAKLPKNSFFLSITSVDWREIWKYGERGFR